jgi:hypothetical protein
MSTQFVGLLFLSVPHAVQLHTFLSLAYFREMPSIVGILIVPIPLQGCAPWKTLSGQHSSNVGKLSRPCEVVCCHSPHFAW